MFVGTMDPGNTKYLNSCNDGTCKFDNYTFGKRTPKWFVYESEWCGSWDKITGSPITDSIFFSSKREE